MFDFGARRVSNVCSVQGSDVDRSEVDAMKLLLEVMLVGYVLYAVLGAPLLAPMRDERHIWRA